MLGWISSGGSNSELVENLAVHVPLSPQVAGAMKLVDRANYCRDKSLAYKDSPQIIGFGATISAPHMHALALQTLDLYLPPGGSVLDVGSGSGYLTACFAELLQSKNRGGSSESQGHVVGIEHIPELVGWSIANLELDGKKDYFQVPSAVTSDGQCTAKHALLSIIEGDGYQGYAPGGPYNVIHVGAAVENVPTPLVDQLKPGGCMVIPVGPQGRQEYLKITKGPDAALEQEIITSVRYVPLTSRRAQLSS